MARVPRIVHYIFGMAPDFGGKPWGLMHHVCLMSAVKHIRPDKIYFHYQYEPTGPWWTLSRPYVTLMPMTAPTEVFGNPLPHVAHRAGVTRLRALARWGGIYLDADVLVQKSFDDLLDYPIVMGEEGEGAHHGMADAVIVSEPNSQFISRWLDSYRTFRSKGRDEFWAEHAVWVPRDLAKQYPDEIHVLPHTAFFWPLWTDDHIKWIFASTRPISGGAFANHLWESVAWKYVGELTPGIVRQVDSNFHRWARPYLDDLPSNYGAPSVGARLEKLRGKIVAKIANNF